ncbi:matrixin family metalloprotease [bacterium]|nr:matrixin family metalloprotease [bacterium]
MRSPAHWFTATKLGQCSIMFASLVAGGLCLWASTGPSTWPALADGDHLAIPCAHAIQHEATETAATGHVALGCQHGTGVCAMYHPRYRPKFLGLDTPNTNTTGEFSVVPGAGWPQPGGRGRPVNISYSYSNILDNSLNGITPMQIRDAVEEALSVWAEVAPLVFTEVSDSGPLPDANETSYPAINTPNLRFGHHPFDGPGGVLAHAYFPLSTSSAGLSGDLHFDDGENWAIVPGPGKIDFLEVCVHEVGHTLGLNHEQVREAVMNPFYAERYLGPGTAFLLTDDIRGVRRIYGRPRGGASIAGDLVQGQFVELVPASLKSRFGF